MIYNFKYRGVKQRIQCVIQCSTLVQHVASLIEHYLPNLFDEISVQVILAIQRAVLWQRRVFWNSNITRAHEKKA